MSTLRKGGEMARRTSSLDIIPLVVLFLISLALTLGASYVLWKNFPNVPDLVYSAPPATRSSGGSFLVTVTITNGSSMPAHLVTFWLHDLGTSIKEFEVESKNLWDQAEGGVDQDNLLIKWERLADHSWARVSFQTSRQVEPRFGENFFIDSEEGAARDKSQLKKLPLREQFLIGVVVCAGVVFLVLSPLTIGAILDGLTGRG
jgi:hypothetical protein